MMTSTTAATTMTPTTAVIAATTKMTPTTAAVIAATTMTPTAYLLIMLLWTASQQTV